MRISNRSFIASDGNSATERFYKLYLQTMVFHQRFDWFDGKKVSIQLIKIIAIAQYIDNRCSSFLSISINRLCNTQIRMSNWKEWKSNWNFTICLSCTTLRNLRTESNNPKLYYMAVWLFQAYKNCSSYTINAHTEHIHTERERGT